MRYRNLLVVGVAGAACGLANAGAALAATTDSLRLCIDRQGAVSSTPKGCKKHERTFLVSSGRSVAELRARAATLRNRLIGLEDDVAALQAENAELRTNADRLEGLLAGVSRPDAGTLRFTGNLQVVNGTGFTDACPVGTTPQPPCAEPNGLGNVIIGYNASLDSGGQTGSHNLVIGDGHTFTSTSGLVSGQSNAVTGSRAFVGGGEHNTASGEYAFVAGGRSNSASATDTFASGRGNNVSVRYSFIAGGANNTAEDTASFVGAGRLNHTRAGESFIGGGVGNETSGFSSAIAGGDSNTAHGASSFIGGGTALTTPSTCAWIVNSNLGC